MWRRSSGLVAAAIAATVAAGPTQAQQARIGGLSDVNFGTWRGSGDLIRETTHCVRSTSGIAGRFNIRATGPAGGPLVLRNGTFTLPYRLSYNDGSGWRDFPGTGTLNNLNGILTATGFTACVNGLGNPEQLRIRILAADLSRARGGTYRGTLVLTVAPE